VSLIGGVHDSGGSCGFACKQVPGARKRLPLLTCFCLSLSFPIHFLPPEPEARRRRRGSQGAGRFPLPRAARMLCAGFAMAPLGGDQRARNSSVAITGKARTNISWQVGRNWQTRMHEPRRIRRQKPRAELPNPAPALRIKLGDKSSSNRRLMGGLL